MKRTQSIKILVVVVLAVVVLAALMAGYASASPDYLAIDCDSTTNWTSGNTIIGLDTADFKEGTASITGTNGGSAYTFVNYDPAGTWDFSTENRVVFWFKTADWDTDYVLVFTDDGGDQVEYTFANGTSWDLEDIDISGHKDPNGNFDWTKVDEVSFGHRNLQTTIWVDYVLIPPAKITAVKRQDADMDGEVDFSTDPFINGLLFRVYRPDGTLLYSDTTQISGRTSFFVAPGNAYTVCEVLEDHWVSTWPGGVGPGEVCTNTGVLGGNGDEEWRENFLNYELGKITIEKETLPADYDQDFDFNAGFGGGSFTLNADSNPSVTYQDLISGTYDVEETVPANWALTDLTCVDASGDTVEDLANEKARIKLGQGEHVTCTFTNTGYGKISVAKQTVPDGAAGTFTFNQDIDGSGDFNLDDDQVKTFNDVVATGTYSVDEEDPSPEFDLTSWVCDDGSDPLAIDLDVGEHVTCIFTNTQRGDITIVKETVDWDDNPFDFDFDFMFSADYAADFMLNPTGVDTKQVVNLEPGTYEASENVAFGWDLVDIDCQESANDNSTVADSTATIELDPGEEVVCTFTNKREDLGEDSDGDGIPDSVELALDRDGDGVPNYLDYDPTGYFYDEITGEILKGGEVFVDGPSVNLIEDGSDGFYRFTTGGVPGLYELKLTLPPGYVLSDNCPAQDPPALDPTGMGPIVNLGAGEDAQNPGFLVHSACTDYYLTLLLEPGDPFIINNNIPLRPRQANPVGGVTEPVDGLALLAPWLGVAALTVLLAGAAAIVWRRRTDVA
jgi:hypothetical protein